MMLEVQVLVAPMEAAESLSRLSSGAEAGLGGIPDRALRSRSHQAESVELS